MKPLHSDHTPTRSSLSRSLIGDPRYRSMPGGCGYPLLATISPTQTLLWPLADRIMKETGAHAVKLEGGEEVTRFGDGELFQRACRVMGHLGLTPPNPFIKFGSICDPVMHNKGRRSVNKLAQMQSCLKRQGCFCCSTLEKFLATLSQRSP